jgi:hypothetical protein
MRWTRKAWKRNRPVAVIEVAMTSDMTQIESMGSAVRLTEGDENGCRRKETLKSQTDAHSGTRSTCIAGGPAKTQRFRVRWVALLTS